MVDKTCGDWNIEITSAETADLKYLCGNQAKTIENCVLQDLRDLKYIVTFAIMQMEKKSDYYR